MTTEIQDKGDRNAQGQTITYLVNGESQITNTRKLTVRQILENAGFTPAESYELTRNNGDHTFKSLDEEVPLHNGEKFTAKFHGPTPVSES